MSYSPKHFSRLLHAANEEIKELNEALATAESAAYDLMELNDKYHEALSGVIKATEVHDIWNDVARLCERIAEDALKDTDGI